MCYTEIVRVQIFGMQLIKKYDFAQFIVICKELACREISFTSTFQWSSLLLSLSFHLIL